MAISPVDRVSRVTAGLALAFLVTTLTAAVVTASRQRDATGWVEHTGAAKLAIAEATLALREAEGAPGSASASRSMGAHLESLKTRTADNAAQQARIESAFRALERARASTAGDAAAFTELRATLRDMRADEDALEAHRAAKRATARDHSDAALAAFAFVTMLLFFGSMRVLARQHKRMATQSAIQESILESIGEAVIAMGADRNVLVANAAARRIFPDAMPGKRVTADWVQKRTATDERGDAMRADEGPLSRALRGDATDRAIFSVTCADATRVWLNGTGRPVRDASGDVIGSVAIYRDVTEQKKHADALATLSITDELTGLRNRRGFTLVAEQRLADCTKSGATFAILFADLNGLKSINDRLGHEAGDRAIRDAARVFQASVRQSDTVARLGGDEFVILVDETTPGGHAAIEKRMRRAIDEENRRNGGGYRLSISTGVAAFDPTTPQTVEALLAEADERMYANKVARQRTGSDAEVVHLRAVHA